MITQEERNFLEGLKGTERNQFKAQLFAKAYGRQGSLLELNRYCFNTDYTVSNPNFKLLLLL